MVVKKKLEDMGVDEIIKIAEKKARNYFCLVEGKTPDLVDKIGEGDFPEYYCGDFLKECEHIPGVKEINDLINEYDKTQGDIFRAQKRYGLARDSLRSKLF